MLEASFLNLSDRSGTDGTVSVWPAWEVQEEGGATSWFQVRLAFRDGARVDALAVMSGGCVRLEDVRATPPLSLLDLTVLADWIEEPLFEACGVPAPDPVKAPRRRGQAGLPGGEDPDGDGRAPDVTLSFGLPAGSWSDSGDAPAGGDDAYRPEGDDHSCAEAECDPWEAYDDTSPGAAVGARRARPAWPRGIEGRRLIAEEYLAAQEEGVDPVLAVMCATGHSRRKSLRLIAQARDAGYLTPRHARR
ncbi:hypothetical protein GCM10020256_68660 [Streptomyces thermocoprophilus]